MISAITTHDGTTIAKGGNTISSAIKLSDIPADAKLLFDLYETGDGTNKVEYLVCATETGTFIVPSSAADIVTAHDKSSGTSGRNVYKLDDPPYINAWMKIKITETGGISAVVPIGRLIIWAGGKF